MFNNIRLLIAIAALIMSAISVTFAQERAGGIEGTIKDPNGAAVPNAEVTIRSAGGSAVTGQDSTAGFTRTAQTDENGFFRVLEVPSGVYTVTVAAISGFSPMAVNNVEVLLGKSTALNVVLTLGEQTATVNVSSEDVAAIDPTDNKIQTNITARQADLLPKGTNFTSILQVAPAVRNEPLTGGFQVDGASGSENTFIIDGQEVTNFRTGSLNQNNDLPFQMIQEVQVKSSGFEAEFGGATGGVINLVTKGGANQFHGEFGMQFRPSELQAGPRPYLRLFQGGTPNQIAEYIRPARLGGTGFFPTANLSGPIVKDRLWFFAGYSPQYFNNERTINYISSNPRNRVAGATEVYKSKQTNEYGFLRLDAAVTDQLRLNGSFTYNPTILEGVLPAVTLVTGSPAQADFGGSIGVLRGPALLGQQGGRRNSNNVTGSAVWSPNDKFIFNLRAGRSFLNEKINQEDGIYSYGIAGITRFICDASSTADPSVSGCNPGFQNVNSNNRVNYDVSIRNTFDADATFLANNLGGRHQFKLGYQYNGISNDVRRGYADAGIVVLYYGTAINEIRPGIDPTEGQIGSGELYRISTNGKASSNSQSIYFQDRWQPFSRLSLNLGLRAERETVPSFTEGAPGIEFNFGDKIAPRLGFAYDLTGDGKTKLFASYGWFYDRFKYELPRGSFGGDFFRVDYFEILPSRGTAYTNYTLAAILGNRPDIAGGNCPAGGITGGTGFSRCQIDARIPSNSPSAPVETAGGIDPNLKPFRQSEFTVGFERELGFWGLLASGRYTHKQVDRAVEDIGFLNAQGSEAYIIGNPGLGLTKELLERGGFVAPKAERRYDALELRLDKRFSNNVYFNANYTFSRLFGNYPGLSSSDEAVFSATSLSTAGRNAPNVNRLFDLPFVAFAADGTPNNGRLGTDRPHAFKFYGAYTLDWSKMFGFGDGNSTEFSAFTTAQSGTPLTTFFDFQGIDTVVLNKRGDLGRTETFTQTDFGFRHKYRFGRDKRFTMAFDLDILNLFNEANVLTRSQLINGRIDFAELYGDATPAERLRLFFTGNTRQRVLDLLTEEPSLRDASFNQPTSFQAPRSVRFGFRFMF
jgi:hypothetical protein